MTNARAVVLLSGGMDSATAAAMTKARGFELYALSFRYGQRHALELEAARRVAAHLGVARHAIVDIDLRAFGGSALTAEIAVPKDRPAEAIGSGIPVTYVPARNTIMLSLAMAWAEVLQAQDIFIGVNAVDYSGYPEYPQPFPPFQHAVSIVDLLFCCGPEAPYFIWGWREALQEPVIKTRIPGETIHEPEESV